MSPTLTGDRLGFGPFVLDRRGRRLLRAGRPVPLEPQPLRVLEALLERPGALVTREQLRRHVWGEQHVQVDDGLNYCIRRIRVALGERAEQPVYLETVPRRGYRFRAPVVASPAAPSPPARRWRAPAATAAVALLALVAALLPRPAALGDDRPLRVAVLPFAADDALRDLAEGLTDDVITELARSDPRHLAVIAGSSTRRYGATPDLETLAEELRAAYVVEGRVAAVEGGYRVSARLVRVADATHVWAESYRSDATDPSPPWHRISAGVFAALAPGSPEATRPERAEAPSPEAQEAYLRGRYLLDGGQRDAGPRSEVFFRRALDRAPRFAEARAALARALLASYGVATARARAGEEAAREALAQDPTLGEAWLALGDVRLFHDRDVEAAAEAYERALAVAPGLALAHKRRGLAHSAAGEHGRALARLGRALELDPVSPTLGGDTAWFYFRARRFEQAVRAARRALELDPRSAPALRCLLEAQARRGEWAEARDAARALLGGGAGATPDPLAGLAPEAAVRAFWEHELERLGPDAPAAFRVMAAAPLGRRDEAFEALAESVSRHEPLAAFLAIEPILDPLRGDPRFAALQAAQQS